MGCSLLLMRLVEVMSDVPAELGEQERSTFLTTALVPDWVFDLDLVKYCAIVQLDE
jgi:hypothetical protein